MHPFKLKDYVKSDNKSEKLVVVDGDKPLLVVDGNISDAATQALNLVLGKKFPNKDIKAEAKQTEPNVITNSDDNSVQGDGVPMLQSYYTSESLSRLVKINSYQELRRFFTNDESSLAYWPIDNQRTDDSINQKETAYLDLIMCMVGLREVYDPGDQLYYVSYNEDCDVEVLSNGFTISKQCPFRVGFRHEL